jgi:hypothetical protein
MHPFAKETFADGSYTQGYSIEKSTEGGRYTKKEVKAHCKSVGMKVRESYSPYVGQYGLDITGTKEQHESLENWLWN